jgi:hypothetical protein
MHVTQPAQASTSSPKENDMLSDPTSARGV